MYSCLLIIVKDASLHNSRLCHIVLVAKRKRRLEIFSKDNCLAVATGVYNFASYNGSEITPEGYFPARSHKKYQGSLLLLISSSCRLPN